MVIVILLATNFSVFASKDEGPWVIKYDEIQNIYLTNLQTGENLIKAFTLDVSGNPVYLDLNDYVQELNRQYQQENTDLQVKAFEQSEETQDSLTSSPDTSVSPQSLIYIKRYLETYTYKDSGSIIKCSPDAIGPATITYGNSVTVTESFSASFNLTAEAKKYIKAGASFAWNDSASTSTSFGVSFSVPSGKTGYVAFSPRRNVSVGDMYEEVWNGNILVVENHLGLVSGYSPIKLSNGFADGVYSLRTY